MVGFFCGASGSSVGLMRIESLVGEGNGPGVDVGRKAGTLHEGWRNRLAVGAGSANCRSTGVVEDLGQRPGGQHPLGPAQQGIGVGALDTLLHGVG